VPLGVSALCMYLCVCYYTLRVCRCFEEGLFAAARVLFERMENHAMLALCYLHLECYKEAVVSAQKINRCRGAVSVCE